MRHFTKEFHQSRLTLAFHDKAVEAEYRKSYFSRSLYQLRHGCIFAIVVLSMFLPYDFSYTGNETGNIASYTLLSLRLLVIFLVFGIAVLTYFPEIIDVGKLSALGWSCGFIFTWATGAVPAYILNEPYAMVFSGFITSFVLVSLTSTTYLPILFFECALLQPFLIFPILHAYLMIRFEGAAPRPMEYAEGITSITFEGITVLAASLMGMYAKYYYESSDRRNFAQDQQLREARSRAEAASSAKSQFLALVSHELRTPLNGIVGNLKIARSSQGDSDVAAALADAERSGLAMRNIINDVLDLTRLDADQFIEPAEVPFSLREVMEDIEGAVKVTALSKGLGLNFPRSDSVAVTLCGDPGRLRHILLNLVGNAIKFTEAGSVTVDCQADVSEVTFSVHDTGMGIPEDQLERVHEEFFRASNAQASGVGGTGLGLAIVWRMVSECGGSVKIVSKVGEGTSVTLALPFPKTGGHARLSQKPPSIDTVGKPLRILVVEDDPVNMAVLRRFLVSDGHKVSEASNAAAALELFDPASFDCVLSDIRLPDLKGTELASRLQERTRPNYRVPIIAVTANVFPEDQRSYRAAGLVEIVTKPIDRDELFATLRRACGISDQDAAAARATGVQRGLGDRATRLKTLIGPDEFACVMSAFEESLKESLANLNLARQEADKDQVRFLAHRIGGGAASIGFDVLAAHARELEAAIAAGRWPVTSEFEATVKAAHAALGQLPDARLYEQ